MNFGSLILSAIGSAEAQLWRVLAGEVSGKAGRHASPASGVCVWPAERVARAKAPRQHSWFITGTLKEPEFCRE
ncbi:MAG: hypothetical protein GY801_06365 [bacterium]|nr:hypothetical protein [bacterium]